MSRVVAIGAEAELAGYGLAGVELLEATEPERVRRAWAALGGDVGLVLLTPGARAALPGTLRRPDLLWLELPG